MKVTDKMYGMKELNEKMQTSR